MEEGLSFAWQQLVGWFESDMLRPVVDRIMSWENAADALRLLEDRSMFGKVVLTVHP